jgi:poly(A) polymerase
MPPGTEVNAGAVAGAIDMDAGISQYTLLFSPFNEQGMTKNEPPAAEPVILESPGHPITRAQIDPDALKIMDRLDRQGFLACLVGGAVRDLMLGKAPKDFDIATDARPGQIKKRFPNAYVIGRRFRLVHVHCPGGKIIEVATFRKNPANIPAPPEGGADDAPVDIFGTPREDAFRRDLTINALLYDGILNAVIDYVGGLEDLACRRIRVIGDPVERFVEDPVRIWRVLRHAARLGFEIESGAAAAIRSHGHLLGTAAGARLYEEFNKDLAYETQPVIEALRNHKLLQYILGRAGEAYEVDGGLFRRLCGLLTIEDRIRSAGIVLSLEEMYALVLWPWLEDLLRTDEPIELHKALHDEFQSLQTGATIPKTVRANVIQIVYLAGMMLRAYRTGHMRWSLRQRAHWPQAERLLFLVEEGRVPETGETFETALERRFPGGAQAQKKRWRPARRRRTKRPAGGP